MKTKLEKEELLYILRKNRGNHEAIWLEALEEYRKKVIEELERSIADAKAKKGIRTYISLQEPKSYLAEYNTVIEMLEMSEDDYVELDYNDFNNYVKDNWRWKNDFLTSNAAYSEAAGGAAMAAGLM
jgi:hypothetical protein